jgi:hypothetical protein
MATSLNTLNCLLDLVLKSNHSRNSVWMRCEKSGTQPKGCTVHVHCVWCNSHAYFALPAHACTGRQFEKMFFRHAICLAEQRSGISTSVYFMRIFYCMS